MELKWRVAARKQFKSILLYVETNFGISTALQARDEILNSIENLHRFPRIGQREESIHEYEVRRLVLTPSSVYYVIQPNTIYILAIVDQRMSPQRILRLVTTQVNDLGITHPHP